MDFEQKKRESENIERYHVENLGLAREFAKELLKEMKELVQSIVLFGSNSHKTQSKESDIDIMVVLDNVSVYVSEELREAYRIIIKSLTQKISPKFHILTVNLSDLWDMARKGDPVLINILRYGFPLFDRTLIGPMQYLLEIGRIRPTREAINNYEARAVTLLTETNKHMQEAVLDLYYAIVDIVHATLMVQKITPPSPKDMPKIFKKTFARKKQGAFSKDIEEFYDIAKEIEHKRGFFVSGSHYDKLLKKAKKIIGELKKFNDEQIKNIDIFEL